jgi:DNA segregation ATPase FtsK/SpoIIIE, S-DNA-T family
VCRVNSSSGPIRAVIFGGLAAVAAIVAPAVIAVWGFLTVTATIDMFLFPVLAAGLGGYVVVRFARLPREVKANVPLAVWARIRWRFITASCGLTLTDKHHQVVIDRRVYGPRLVRGEHVRKAKQGRTRVPGAKIIPTAFGVLVRVKTLPGIGRKQWEAAAEHLANFWRVARVTVTQPSPGIFELRALRTDPLTVPYPAAEAPLEDPDPANPYLGRDENSEHRHLSVRNHSGIVIGGIPGRGKSELIRGLLVQWAPSAVVQLARLDGKDSGDYEPFDARMWRHAGDDLAEAVEVLEDVHMLMRRRLKLLRACLGTSNAWSIGPTETWPLIVLIVDECQQYLDLNQYGPGGAKPSAERKLAERCAALIAQLVRKGRSVMVVCVLASQKCTSDSIPTAIRDNCGQAMCLGVRTIDAAAAVLGADIRQYPSYSPTGLLDVGYQGVATTTLPNGQDPFCRVRVPYHGEDAVNAVAAASAPLRQDPAALLDRLEVPDLVPDDLSELDDIDA